MKIKEHPSEEFLKAFTSKVSEKRHQLCEAVWLLETTNSPEAVELVARLSLEESLFYSDSETYQQLLTWDHDGSLKDLLLKRQLNVLVRAFKYNQGSKSLMEEISKKEAALSQSYVNFRPEFEGWCISENDILEILKGEINPLRRLKAWEASKFVGDILAPQILDLVSVRNKVAQELGYTNYFQMKLDMEEVDEKWLINTFEDLIEQSESEYSQAMNEIEQKQIERFSVRNKDLGPWAWSDPFSQNDPLDDGTLDELVKDADIIAA